MCSNPYSNAADQMKAQMAAQCAPKAPAEEVVLMIEAYLRLLKLSHRHNSRSHLQSVMAGLRDEIARVTGWKPERVQDQCEGMVALLSATK